MRPRRITTPDSRRRRSGLRVRRGRGARRGTRARLERSRARARRRTPARPSRRRGASAPSSGPPASALRTVSSSRAARISGSVGVPSRRSVPAILPVSIVRPEQSRMSSAIWKAIPSASPNSPRPGASAPSRQAASKSFPVLSAQAGEVSSSASCRVVRLGALHRLAADEGQARAGEAPRRPRGRRSP